MKLPLNIALLLQKLEQGELINPSQINSKWAANFVDDGLILVSNFILK